MAEDIVDRLQWNANLTLKRDLSLGMNNLLLEAANEILRLRASRSEVIEECAKKAMEHRHSQWRDEGVAESVKEAIAEDIRSLKEPPHGDGIIANPKNGQDATQVIADIRSVFGWKVVAQ